MLVTADAVEEEQRRFRTHRRRICPTVASSVSLRGAVEEATGQQPIQAAGVAGGCG